MTDLSEEDNEGLSVWSLSGSSSLMYCCGNFGESTYKRGYPAAEEVL